MAVADQGRIIYRRRRQLPLLTFGLATAVFVGAAATTAAMPWSVLLGALTILLVGAGMLAHRRVWTEDQIITERAIKLIRPDGSGAEIPLARLVRATAKGACVRFVRDDGALLDFNGNPAARKVLRAVAAIAPMVEYIEQVDLACPT